MSTLKSTQQPESVSVDLKYRLSAAGVEKYIATTGKKPGRDFLITVSLPELQPPLRARVAAIRNHIPALPGLQKLFSTPSPIPAIPELDEVTTDPAVVVGAWEQLVAAREAARAAQARIAAERLASEEHDRVAFRAEMTGWISLNGSERLKIAAQRGYRITSLYLLERTTLDLPGFVIDTNHKLRWEERANPSATALEIETYALERAVKFEGNHKVRIVWLTHDLDGNDLSLEVRKKREAVVVTPYLRFYTAVREVADGLPS